MIDTSQYIIPLAECSSQPVGLVGAKARTLGRLLQAGLPVPDGVCVTTAAFRAIRDSNSLGEDIKAVLRRAELAPVTLGSALAMVRRMIHEAPLPHGFEHQLLESADPLLRVGRVVARSSSPHEDDEIRSYAGIFDSEVNIAEFDELANAVRHVWASLFSERVNYYCGAHFAADMAVLIQRQVTIGRGGVLFSRNPLTDEPLPVIELGPTMDAVTSGKGGETVPSGQVDAWLQEHSLGAEISVIERVLGAPVDVEFAVAGGNVEIFQARPVTTSRARKSVSGVTWALQEDLNAVRALSLGECDRLLMRQLVKHVPYRRVCQSLGIPLFDIYYLTYSWDALRQEVMAEFLAALSQPYLRVDWGTAGRSLVLPEKLAAVLAEGKLHNQVGVSASTAQVGTVIAAELTGNAAVAANGDVLIEAFPAGLPNLKSGKSPGSVYVIDPDDKMREYVPATYDCRWELDPASDVAIWRRVPLSAPTNLSLRLDQLSRLASICTMLTEHLGEVRLEWYADSNEIYVKDVSIETNTLPVAAAGMLSPGIIEGTAIRVPDLTVLERPEITDKISVTEHERYADIVAGAPALGDLTARLAAASGRPIVVAPYPSLSLIPLVRHAAGFVFERGSLLCHTAIVLRENNVPAYVVPDILTSISEGQHIVIGQQFERPV